MTKAPTPASPAYIPRPDSLAASVVYFFRNNPDEELSLDDIVDKFAATTRGNIHTQLVRPLEAGFLRRERNADGEYIYSAGPAISILPKGASLPAKADKATGFKSPRHHIDIDALPVDKGVPFLPKPSKGGNKWAPLFDKLANVGDSVEIPAFMATALKSAARERNKLRDGKFFRCAITSENLARVWRLAPPPDFMPPPTHKKG